MKGACRLLNAGMIFACAYLLWSSACKREERTFRDVPQPAGLAPVFQSPIRPGAGAVAPSKESKTPYEESAYAVAEGERLFGWYNCVGCHAHGGGAIGPPLMDDIWIYGSRPENIFATIVEGRPNGMPSFRGRIPDNQVWQLVAYVRSMSGLVAKDVAPGRSDDLAGKQPESEKKKERPR